MTALNKLNRALDALKKVIAKPPEFNKQKEKVSLCLTITDLVCKSNEKSALLTFTVSSLIQLLEDADSNTRLIIDESLNKIIRASMDNSNYVAKVLIALLKVLGKSTHEKCLKAALWRFSELAQFVRPQKGKIYVQTLVPIISKIAARKDVSIVETLAESLPNIFKHIGLFSSDNDIKNLLKAFVKNLHSESPEIRRAAAVSIIAICKHSRQPEYFFTYILTAVLDLLCDCQKSDKECRNLIQGCLSCIRNILPHVSNPKFNINNCTGCEHLIQVYELCLQYAKYHDHNVITAALETLNELLQEASPLLIRRLTTKGGLTASTIRKRNDLGSTLSLGGESDIMSIGSTIARTDDGAFIDSVAGKRTPLFSSNSGSCTDLNFELKQRTEQWIHEHPSKENESISSSLLNINTSHFANSDEDTNNEVDSRLVSSFRATSLDDIQMQQFNDHNTRQRFPREKSVSISMISNASSSNSLSIDFDIGEVVDDTEMPLHYCARFLISAFLLENKTSKKVRVSVLSLTLNCFAQILRINPQIANISVERNGSTCEGFSNLIQVVLSYGSHEDQQVRGLVCVVIGNFILSSLIQNNYLINESDHLNESFLNELIGYLLKGLEDESSVCVKHTLQAISLCVHSLLLSSAYKSTIPVLEAVFTLVDNPYWLIKVKILEILEEVSFELLYYVGDNTTSYQDRSFRKVIITLLGDIDGRVRTAAASCLVKFVKSAYYPLDHKHEPVSITFGKKLNSELSIPFDSANKSSEPLERSLTRTLYKMQEMLKTPSSKHAMAGVVEAMSVLAAAFPPVTFAKSWQCRGVGGEPGCLSFELFETIVQLLTSSTLLLNFDVHLQLLRLSSQVFVALCSSNLKLKKFSDIELESIDMWSFLSSQKLKDLSEQYLLHLIRVASVFNDVVTNITIKSPVSLNTSSQVVWPLPIDQPMLPKQEAFSFCTQTNAKSKSFFKLEEKPISLVNYGRLPLYVKLAELLKSAFNNYRVTLKPESSEKFITFMKTVVDSIGITLNYTTISETDRISKDLLSFLRNFMVFIPVSSVKCVVQLLRSVFGINEVAEKLQDMENGKKINSMKPESSEGFFKTCIQSPYDRIANFCSHQSQKNVKSRSSKRKNSKDNSSSSVVKQPQRNVTVNMLPSYINCFEPSVIQSLRQYTVSSDTELQAEVLGLLTELVQLKTNYCLLDSEQVFIKFVLSQFQLIEEGQLLNIENLLPKMFGFLINLANEKHSKPVMSVPKVIQLCDSLIASGQAISHCILAIEPVVEHVFLRYSPGSNATEIKELETQRDVLFTMLLRLIHDPRSLRLIAVVLNDSDEESKLRRSCQVVETFFNALIEGGIPIDDDKSYTNLTNLLFALHPSSFTEQHILNVLFTVYINHKADIALLPSICAVLMRIVANYSEAVLLKAVEQMLSHAVFIDDDDTDPLFINVTKDAEVVPEKAFVRFLCKVIYKIFQRINDTKLLNDQHHGNKIWTNKILSEFVLIISFLIKSGKYESIKNELMLCEYPNENGKKFCLEIADLCNCLLVACPIIVLRWYELLLILKSSSPPLWGDFLQSNVECDTFGSGTTTGFSDQQEEKCCLSVDVVKLGVFLLASLRKHEILSNAQTYRAFLEFNFKQYLISIAEPPVQQLQIEVQSSLAASDILLQVIQNMLPLILNDNTWLKHTLQYLESTYPKFKGQVLMICCNPQILNNSCLLVSNRAHDLAMRQIKYLATIEDQQEFETYLKEEDVLLLAEHLKQSKYSTQMLKLPFGDMISKWYQTPLSPNERKTLSFDRLKLLTADKQWFFTHVKYKCCQDDDSLNPILARLLGHLPLEDVFSIMKSQNFNNKIICDCFIVGAELTLQNRKLDAEQAHGTPSGLYLASRLATFRHLEHLKLLLPRTHQVYLPVKREPSKKETQYSQRMDNLFADKEFNDTILCLITAIDQYISTAAKLQIDLDSDESLKLLADFPVLSLELVHWMIKNNKMWSKTIVMSALKCCTSILSDRMILKLLTHSQMGSIISCVYELIERYQNEVIKVSLNSLLQELKTHENWDIIHSSHLLSTLIDYFINKLLIPTDESNSFGSLVKQLLIVLSQSTSVYNYLRIPLEVWRHVSIDDVTVGSCISLNSLPESFLQDREIMQNFVSRLTLIGWNNRLQFEECWMSLLVALNSIPEHESSEEEVLALSQINSMAVNSITSLLVQTMYHPIPGNKISPNVFHVSRNKYCDDVECRWRQKLEVLNNVLLAKTNMCNGKLPALCKSVNINIERIHNENLYGFNQISIEYLTFSCTNSFNNEEDVPVSYHFQSLRSQYKNRSVVMKNLGIDTNSCIYFLMEFYSRWLMKPDNQSVEVLIEILNSMLAISDLFTELSQFTWLLESGVLLWKKYSRDDDAVCAYLTIIICKSSSIATPEDSDSQKLIIRILKSGLNSTRKIVQRAALHGLLYLLESIFKKDVLEKNEVISGEYKDGILSASILFVLENLDIELAEKFSSDIVSCVISIAFYLIENKACGDNSDIVVDRLCKLSVRACKLKKWKVHLTIMQGFYNLILYENETIKKSDSLMQLVKEIFSLSECTVSVSVISLQILVSIMYSSGDFEDTRNTEESSDMAFDTENLVKRIEKLSIFFERIKKSSKQETQVICAILPQIISDFFSVSEVLNKVILEFLSPNHPHTELMADVVFQVFQNAIQQSHLKLIQDWVLSLLNNFSKYSLPTAVFYLNCFFISASTNPWLIALYPFVTRRNGYLEYEDRKIVNIAAKQFHSQLSDENQKTTFLATFQSAEKIHPDSPFSEIIKIIS
ncbi:huntingtin isoform X2 [Planococcus citri]|uniref:huntingtin isoform X2 n=1 Tax=Planococcus citri TaxID=170843 RepID=UPI0031F7E135